MEIHYLQWILRLVRLLAQFIGATSLTMQNTVWIFLAPPKCKLFVWLIIQNRVWMADRLQRQRCPNSTLFPLCKRYSETTYQHVFQCRYTIHIWGLIKDWLGLHDIGIASWSAHVSMNQWCNSCVTNSSNQGKALGTIMILVTWMIWNEINVRIFRTKSTMPTDIFSNIKTDVTTWVKFDAKHRVRFCLWCIWRLFLSSSFFVLAACPKLFLN